MGCSVREKHIRANRRARSAKPDTDHGNLTETSLISKTAIDSGIRPLNYQLGVNESAQNSIPNPNPNFDDGGWGYCTEEKLEEILLKNLEFLYNEAISKLVAMGYDEDVALKAILRSGHCCGGMDVLTNIMHHSLTYLGNGGGCVLVDGGNTEEDSVPNFVDLWQLEEYSLATLVCLLQQLRPHLSKGDAMWCLLLSELHLGRASVMEIPVLPSAGSNGCSSSAPSNVESVGNNLIGVAPSLCRFHGGWGFGNGGTSEFPGNGFFSYASEMTLQKEIEYPKRFNLTPSMKSLLKRNVTMFAAGFRANSKQLQMQSQACAGSLPTVHSSIATASGDEVPSEWTKELLNSNNQDVVNSVLSKFCDLNLDENTEYVPEDQKDEMILTLIHQIKDLERQVKERKEWAHQKAMQAARKLSNDIMELKMLRMEKEETQLLKKGKQTLEDTTMKRLSEMENALRKASGQVDRANAAVRRLENENAEIRAEMEAAKLSASESVKTCLEVAKREKKCLKRLLAWEKQKTKLQEEIAAEKQKISELQQQLVQIEAAQREAEGRWRLEQEARELAQTQVDEERRLKEATEASIKRKHEALHLKIEIDSQRQKDDLQRLEQELSRLKASVQSAELHQQSNGVSTANSEGEKPQVETIARLLNELDKLEVSSEKEVNHQRECLICMKDEVSVVFLPCAHQVLCTNCNEGYGKKGKATCPCCRVPIVQRIRVFGVSS